MTAPNGGRWIFSITGQPVVLGFNNGAAPVFPPPQGGAFNIEVFTNTTVGGVPNPDPGFQSSMNDAGGTLENGFLSGTKLVLGGGSFLVVDSVTGSSRQSGSYITLGSGNQTVVGAQNDTIQGSVNTTTASQILNGLAGRETVSVRIPG